MRAITAALVCTALLGTAHSAPPQSAPPTALVPAPKDSLYPGIIALTVDASNMTQDIIVVTRRFPLRRRHSHAAISRVASRKSLATARTRIGRVADWWSASKANQLPGLATPSMFTHFICRYRRRPLRWMSTSSIWPQLRVTTADRETTTKDPCTLDWDAVVLYPAGYYARQYRIEPRLVVPCRLADGHSAGACL